MLDDRINVSYPDGMGGEDGFIYVMYDHERYLCGDVLLARFTEEDVAAGKIVTPGSRLQILVNSSGGTGHRLPGEMTEPPQPPAVEKSFLEENRDRKGASHDA